MNQHIHLIGIGGTGMGPLAMVFLEMGHKVCGSDIKPS
jgi:UDP-N-acetylmuramate-alanine ligase